MANNRFTQYNGSVIYEIRKKLHELPEPTFAESKELLDFGDQASRRLFGGGIFLERRKSSGMTIAAEPAYACSQLSL